MQTVCRYSSEVPEAPFYAVSGDAVVVQILSHRASKIKGFGFPKPFDFALSSNIVLTKSV